AVNRTGDLGYFGQCRIMFAQYFPSAFQKIFAGFGQDHAARRSRKKLQPDFFFKLADLHRDRRLRYIYAACTSGKSFRFRDREKSFELSDLHILYSAFQPLFVLVTGQDRASNKLIDYIKSTIFDYMSSIGYEYIQYFLCRHLNKW